MEEGKKINVHYVVYLYKYIHIIYDLDRESNMELNLIDRDNLPDDFHFNQFLLDQDFINEERSTRTSTNRLRF